MGSRSATVVRESPQARLAGVDGGVGCSVIHPVQLVVDDADTPQKLVGGQLHRSKVTLGGCQLECLQCGGGDGGNILNVSGSTHIAAADVGGVANSRGWFNDLLVQR